jgi:predicted O-methyltransferase YrrM
MKATMNESDSNPTNSDVKNYLDRRFSVEPSTLHHMRVEAINRGLPDIHIPMHTGKFLYLLTKIMHPAKILEIGTLGGYSTGWLAEGLPEKGWLLSLEVNAQYAEETKKQLKQHSHKNIEIRVGHAVDVLAQIDKNQEGPFDLIFIDADKENNVLYFDWAVHLSRPGSLILIDNIIPKGPKVGYPSHNEAQLVYEFNDYIAQHSMVEIAVIPSITGSQARLDGLALVRVKEKTS